MADPALLLTLASAGTAAIAMAAAAALKGWNGWLEVKRLEVARGGARRGGPPEIKELRERLRRLEAIAEGR